jgi:hypothetical protein
MLMAAIGFSVGLTRLVALVHEDHGGDGIKKTDESNMIVT